MGHSQKRNQLFRKRLNHQKNTNQLQKMLRKVIVAAAAVAISATPLQKPCQDLFDKCLAEISTMGEVSESCEQMPWCNADGYFFQGPVCDGTCKCLDRTTGEVAVSSEGYTLETSVVLPDEVFDSDNRLDCGLFSSDQSASASLADNLSAELLAMIESRR